MSAVSEKDKERWDALIKPCTYEEGDLVMLTHEGKFGLEPNFKGPYIVTRAYEEFGTFQLETVAGEPLKSLVHKDRLMPAKGPKPESSWYDPTEARREVKRVTSTRSGRGGGGSHVTPDFIDPIIHSTTIVDQTPQENVSFRLEPNETEPLLLNDSNGGNYYDGEPTTTTTQQEFYDDDEEEMTAGFFSASENSNTSMMGDEQQEEMITSIIPSAASNNGGDTSMSEQEEDAAALNNATVDNGDAIMVTSSSDEELDTVATDNGDTSMGEEEHHDVERRIVTAEGNIDEVVYIEEVEREQARSEEREESRSEEIEEIEEIVEIVQEREEVENSGDQIDERVIGDLQPGDEIIMTESSNLSPILQIPPEESRVREEDPEDINDNVNLSPISFTPQEESRVREEAPQASNTNLSPIFFQTDTGGGRGRPQISEGGDVRPDINSALPLDDDIPDFIRNFNRNRKRKFTPSVPLRRSKRTRTARSLN
ncbi:unnamed protein product [Mucor hiemalis]